jgi:sec-independent protein translocase protein TatA
MFSKFGIWEAVIILVVVLIIFGVGKLPQVGNAVGKGLRAFRRGQSGEETSEEEEEVEKKQIVAAKRKKPATRKSTKS